MIRIYTSWIIGNVIGNIIGNVIGLLYGGDLDNDTRPVFLRR